MIDQFANRPPPPVGSPAQRRERENRIKAWRHELAIKIPELDKALGGLLKPALSTTGAHANKRVEHEIKRLTALTNAILKGLERT